MNGRKVSIIIPDLSGYGTTRAYTIGEGLKRLGFQVKLYGFLFGKKIYPIPPYGLPVTYFYGKPFPSLIKTMWDLMGEIDGDIIYVIKPQMTSFGVGYLKAWREKKPIIVDLDDWEMAEWGGDDWQFNFQGNLRKPGHPIYVKFLERILDKVNAITVSSRYLQYRYGGTYLPNVRDTDAFNPSNYDSEKLREENGLSNYRLLMFTGTAKPSQGIEDVLTALEILNNPQLKLVLVGGNCHQESYYQQLWERWGRWIVTIKPQAFDEMARVISLSHIIVFTPHDSIINQAKCPLEVIEGMAMAKPILASAVGETPAILGNTGFLVSPQSPEAIAKTINEILVDYESALKRGELARQRCLQHYSMVNLTKNLETVLRLI